MTQLLVDEPDSPVVAALLEAVPAGSFAEAFFVVASGLTNKNPILDACSELAWDQLPGASAHQRRAQGLATPLARQWAERDAGRLRKELGDTLGLIPVRQRGSLYLACVRRFGVDAPRVLAEELARRIVQADGMVGTARPSANDRAAIRTLIDDAHRGDARGRLIADLAALDRLKAAAEAEIEATVHQARGERLSWNAIGEALGVTGEAVRRRFKPRRQQA